MSRHELTQRARRAATASSVLDTAAYIGLGAGLIFWINFFVLLIEPDAIIEGLVAWIMGLAYAIVLPILLSTLVPSTPAGMVLQQTRWRTIGFVVTIGVTLFLCGHAFFMLWSWWLAQPRVVETGQDLFLAFGSTFILIFVPALAWVQAAPDRWAAEVIASMKVTRLKMAQEANLTLMRAQYVRSLSLMRRGIANLAATEREELAHTLVAFQRAENESISAIVDTLEHITGIGLAIPTPEDDEGVLESYTGITTELRRLVAPIREIALPNADDYVEPEAPASASRYTASGSVATGRANDVRTDKPQIHPVTPHQEALQRDDAPNGANTTVAQSSAGWRRVAQGDVGASTHDPDYAEFAASAAEHFTNTFTVKRLGEHLKVSESQARAMLTRWLDLGWVDRTNLRGHYCWKENGR